MRCARGLSVRVMGEEDGTEFASSASWKSFHLDKREDGDIMEVATELAGVSHGGISRYSYLIELVDSWFVIGERISVVTVLSPFG